MTRLRFVLLLLTPLLIAAFLFRLGYGLGMSEPVHFPELTVASSDGARLDTLLRTIAAEVWHGSRDDQKSIRDLAALVLTRKLSLTCGYVSAYGLTLLRQAGYQAKLVYLYTLQPYDGNDGHVVLSVYHPTYRSWVIVDEDFNRMYLESVDEFLKARTTPILLANDRILDPAQFGDMPDPDPEAPNELPRVAQRAVPVE